LIKLYTYSIIFEPLKSEPMKKLVFFVLICLNVLSSPLWAQIPSNGLVAWYPFNGNANDESGNGRHGVVTNAAIGQDRNGHSNSAYFFDGSSAFIQLPAFPEFNNTNQFSISVWVKILGYNSNTNCNLGCSQFIISRANDFAAGHFKIAISETVGQTKFGGNITNNPNSIGIISPNLQSFPMSNWMHLVMAYNGSQLKFYENGQLVATTNTTQLTGSSTLPVMIGKHYSPASFPYFVNGGIDDVAFYNRGLTAQEVQTIYTSSTTPCTPITSNVDQTIIEGQTYSFGSQSLTTAGTYTEVFTSAAGCDSTVTLTLAVEPLLTCNITAPTTTLCEGESVTLSVNTTGGAGASSQLPANLQQGLVAYYPFNGNANDESGNGNNGTVNGATLTSDRFGNSSTAYIFDGIDDYINVLYTNQLHGQTGTVNAWIKASNTFSSQKIIFAQSSGRPQLVAASQGINGNQSSNSAGIHWKATNGQFPNAQSASVVDNGDWIMITAFYTTDTFKVYINSLLEASVSTALTQDNCSQSDFQIGGFNTTSSCGNSVGFSQMFSGRIDDIAIYNRALSPAEIQQLYTSQSYAWSNSASTPTITVTPTQNTTYSCTVTQGNQTCTASVDITVNPNITNTISATIIDGETYTLGTQTLTTAGTYTELFTSAAGCDSTVTLTLNVEPLLTCNITAPTTTLCEGESVILSAGATTINTEESINQFLANHPNLTFITNYNGHYYFLDNTVSLWSQAYNYGNANGFPMYRPNDSAEELAVYSALPWIGTDNKAYWLGLYQNPQAPNYSEPFGGWFWTDGTPMSQSYTNWEINEPNNSGGENVAQFEWDNDGIKWNDAGPPGNPGTHNSYAIFELNFLPFPPTNNQSTIVWSTNASTPTITVSPTQTTTYSATVTQGNQTCTASVDITVNPAITNALIATIVEGQSYTLGTQTLTTAGTYTEVFTSAAGCDSTVTLTLAVEPLLTCNITAPTTTLCEGESVTLSVNTTGGAGTSSQLPANLQQGLVAYYPFNGNANDESGNGNNPSVSTILYTIDRQGNANAAGNFLGNQYAIIPNSPSLQITNDFSIAYWTYLNTDFPWSGWASTKAIFTKDNDYPYGAKLFITPEGDSLSLYFGTNMWDGTQTYGKKIPRSQLLGAWHHFTWTYESNMGKLYVDGNLIHSQSCNPNWSSANGLDLHLGVNGDPAGWYPYKFVGKMDDLGIWSRALTATEIANINQTANFLWNNGISTSSQIVSPASNTTFTCTVTQGNQTCTSSIDITVNPLLTWYADADGDGFGNANSTTQACDQPAGFVADNADCNDNSNTTYPGAEEICFDQVDNNCNGTVDENCAIYGCINPNACNFNPAANTDDGSCILPQPEVCNNLDDNCNNQIDEGLSFVNYYIDNDGDGQGTGTAINACASPGASYVTTTGDCNDNNNAINSNASEICDAFDNDCDGQTNEGLMPADINAINVNTALYPSCTSGNLFSANLNNGVNTAVITGNGPDLWYRLTAQYNTLRVGLSAATGNNSIGIYQDMGGCLMLISEEHETTTGNQTLLTDGLTVGGVYYIGIHQVAAPSNTSAKACFNHLVPSTCDHVYSNNTGVYANVCSSFKAQFKANATNYIFNILSATQNGSNLNITPWSYTTPTSSSIVTRLGTLLPANMSASNKVYTLSVPVIYGLYDAANNLNLLTANATSTCTVTLQPETGVVLRTTDRCPNIKTITQSIATDRSICGALRYEWELTQILPTAQAPITVLGGLNSNALFLNTVPGMANGKTYNVRVRPIHSTGEVGNYGAVQCMKTTGAGMVMEDHPSSANAELPLLSLRAGGEMVSLFPNPTLDGQVTLIWEESQESVKQLTLRDVQGRVVWKQQVVIEGNGLELDWKALDTGIYLLEVDGQTMRVVKG
jgi:hypothetical protein